MVSKSSLSSDKSMRCIAICWLLWCCLLVVRIAPRQQSVGKLQGTGFHRRSRAGCKIAIFEVGLPRRVSRVEAAKLLLLRGEPGHGIDKVIKSVRRMIDAVATAARSAPFQSTKLSDQSRMIQQFYAGGIDQRQQVAVQVRLRRGAR